MFDTITVYQNKPLNLDETLQELIDFGYQRAERLGEKGDFCLRGGIVDIFPVNYDRPVRIELSGEMVDSIYSFDLTSGRLIQSQNLIILLPKRGVSPARFKPSEFVLDEDFPVRSVTDMEPGDYVVHVNHGIGQYLGIKKLKSEEGYKEYIAIEYAEGDRLYVPCDRMYLVQKYMGFEGRAPKLYKLGTRHWQVVKDRAKQGIWDLAGEMLQVQAARAALSGFSFSSDTNWQKEFEGTFPYKETPDQLKTADEIKKDMELPKPMDRLVCGDVGYGKTEVAFRAAFKAVMNHKQVAMLVPTTILAEQHYTRFKERLSYFPIRVEMLSRFRTKAEQEIIIKEIKEGLIDVIIGTHRLFSPDVEFSDLGLVIIDEEQRFGVRHKEKFKRLRLLVDVLTLTATPIPRTLYMSLTGVKDMSIINTPPEERQPIETYVGEDNDELVKDAVLNELNRGGQVYFIHNRVENIAKVAERLRALVPHAKIVTAHGQMHERVLEDVMLRFIRNEFDILVSTTIIESGIDIPNVNTIIVNRADCFGLADLYQLRGRVGRSERKAYAYFLVPKDIVLTQDVEKRLKAIERYTELGSGFKIAMEDLEIRGAGNILGEEQHGFITAIGFDLYCRLLREAVHAQKGSPN